MSRSKRLNRAGVLACATLASMLAPSAAHAIWFDWSANEIACATSKGINLDSSNEPSEVKFVEHMSWIADRIVTGYVGEIRHDITGPYKTLVTLTVVSALKGGITPGTNITIALTSGPSYNPGFGVMVEQMLYGEASFTSGQNVLLFLSTGFDIDPNDPARFALPPNHYRLVDGHKFTLQGGSFVQDGNPSNTFTVGALNARISAILQAQQSMCGAGQ